VDFISRLLLSQLAILRVTIEDVRGENGRMNNLITLQNVFNLAWARDGTCFLAMRILSSFLSLLTSTGKILVYFCSPIILYQEADVNNFLLNLPFAQLQLGGGEVF
jgi:hypothetical protein